MGEHPRRAPILTHQARALVALNRSGEAAELIRKAERIQQMRGR